MMEYLNFKGSVRGPTVSGEHGKRSIPLHPWSGALVVCQGCDQSAPWQHLQGSLKRQSRKFRG